MRLNFRSGFYLGLLVAAAVGTWLWQLWQPARQVELHCEHLIEAVEEKDWEAVAGFVDDAYQDQWKQDRALMLSRLQEVLHFARNLRLRVDAPVVSANSEEGNWSARVTVAADANEVSEMIKTRVNAVGAPFELRWQRKSGKPWDWKLVRVSNAALELPEGTF